MLSLLAAPAAHGHAVLLGTDPAPQQLLTEPPTEVRLTFSERVSLKLGGVEIFSPAGTVVSQGPGEAQENVVTAPVTSTEKGTYAVSWRVISADGHPVRGAFVFSSGERSQASAAQKQAFAEAKSDVALARVFGVVRFGYLAAILLAVGGAVFAAVVAPRWTPRLVAPALWALIGFSVVGFFLQAAIAGNVGVLDAVDGDVIETQLSTIYGNATLVRIALAVLGLIALRAVRPFADADRVTRLAAGAVFVLLAFSLSLSGHAMATTPTILRLPLDMLHVLVAAVWTGGLFQLHRYVSRGEVDPAVVVRWSKIALTCVIVLVATGTYAALAESDISLRALVDTTYGRVLAVKIGLLILTMPVANLNRTKTVPAIVAGLPDGPSRLRRYVRIEIALLVAIVGFTAWLVEAVPARHDRHKLPSAPAPVVETRPSAGGARATFTVEPGSTGANAIAVRVRTASGQPDGSVDAVRVTGTLTKRRISRLDLQVRRTGPGQWRAPVAVLPFAGRWRFEVSIRRGEFDEEVLRVDAEIRAPAGAAPPGG